MSAAQVLRREDPTADVLVASPEPDAFYYRAALTNHVLGACTEEELVALPPARWTDLGLRRETDRALALDAAGSRVHLERQGWTSFDTLLVATGARARRLDGVPGSDAPGVHVLRTIADARALMADLRRARRAVVLGGGILGIEAAHAMARRGMQVTVVHRGPWLMERVLDRTAGELVAARMEADGVKALMRTEVQSFETGRTGLRAVRLTTGEQLAADVVVIAIGNAPNTEWLDGTGIELDRGRVPVDRHMRVRGAKGIWAAGDVALFRDPALPFSNADGLWQPAAQQGAVAGASMARPGDGDTPDWRPGAILNATRVWDLDLATLGDHVDSPGDPAVVERHLVGGQPVYKRLLLREGRLVGALLLGDRREATALRRLMNLRGEAVRLASVAAELLAPTFDLDAWVAAQERAPGVGRWDRVGAAAPLARPAGHATTRVTTQRELGRPKPGATALHDSLPPPELRLLVDGSLVAPRTHRDGSRGLSIASSQPADVVLPAARLGDARLEIRLEGMVWMARVHGSSRAVLQRAGRVEAGALALRHGDLLQVGDARIQVSLEEEARGTAKEPEQPAFLLGPQHRHALEGRHVRIGRDPANDIVLPYPDVSRFHVQLQRDPRGTWLVLPLDNAAVRVRDTPVLSPRRLEAGDALYLGSVCLTFHVNEADGHESAGAQAPTVLAFGDDLACLVGREGPHHGAGLLLAGPATIGRGAEASVRVDDPLLSRLHAKSEPARAGLILTDLGGANGTRVRGEAIAPHVATPLAWGEEVQLGRTTYVLHRGLPDGIDVAEIPAPAAAEAVTVFAGAAAHRLELHAGDTSDDEPTVFPLVEDLVRIGRSTSAEIPLADRRVSRDHCRLSRTPEGGYAITDCGSRHGTHVAQDKLDPGTPRVLADRDEIALGGAILRYRTAPLPAGEQARIAQASATEPRLEVLDADASLPSSLTLRGAGPWTIGREARRVTVHLPIETVSRVHLRIERTALGAFLATNLSSLGVEGLTHNGSPVQRDGRVELQDGDELQLQVARLRFRVDRSGARLPATPIASRFERLEEGPNPLEWSLSGEVQREFEACIGCHECMRACPLDTAREVTIAGLNAYGVLDGEPGDTVRRFVADCTQCHACVPVCPAGLRRSRMVLWNKLKHVPRETDRLPLQVGQRSLEGPLRLGELANRLQEHVVFSALEHRASFLRLLGTARLRQLEPKEPLVHEGTYADAFWVILDGTLDAYVKTAARRPVHMVTLGAGQVIGERSVLGDQEMEATYEAAERSLVLGFSRYALEQARRESGGAALGEALDRLYATRSREAALERLGLDAPTRDALGPRLRPERHRIGASILDRSEAAGTLGVISRGFVRVVRRRDGTERWADYLRPGDTFGGPQRDTAAGAFLRYEAASVAEVFLIDRDELQDLVGVHPDLAHAFERPARREDARGAEPAQRGLTGALQAHQLLVIDTRLCVDCDNCVDACERRHGMPRLDRRGTATIDGPWQVPTSCYHCVDPLCLYCSVDGIVREPSGEIRIVEENCIGCGQCAERCPYDNIFMVAREPQRRSLLEWLVPKPVRRLFGVRDGRVILEDHEQLAVKCDLCHGYGDGPACVRSCPTGAAQRDEPAAIFGVGRS